MGSTIAHETFSCLRNYANDVYIDNKNIILEANMVRTTLACLTKNYETNFENFGFTSGDW